MKKTIMILANALAIAGAASVATAAPPEKEVFHFRDGLAHSDGVGDDECEARSFLFNAFENRTQVPGEGASDGSFLVAQIHVENQCTGIQIDGNASLPVEGFSMSLDGAAAAITFEAQRFGGGVSEPVEVQISVEWTGVGDILPDRFKTMFDSGGTIIRMQTHGKFRQANITVMVTIDGVPLEFDEAVGDLFESKSGSMTITHP
ncbi:hypothetical protein [Nannocystis punicea]|uniref:Uncharacterized protein n=1 Tax=Nannocystis punicea TaxID=2995304 RepID=A0ABY7GSD8_9BACT|nr:hypothetical protein [Nannocystis poenicansa]WAS89863.1 hypothetical protein O0S08_27030 [Nannocystis poenicansa]